MSTTATPPDTLRVEVHYSFLKCAGAAALFLWFAGWALFWGITGLSTGHGLAMVIGGLAILVLVPLLLPFLPSVLHPWRHRGPVLVLDEDGVTDYRKTVPFIPWSDIRSVSVGSGETANFLCFSFRHPDPRREDPPGGGLLGRMLKRAAFLSDWNVSLRLLRCHKQDLLRSARDLHRLSVRRRVIALNPRGDAPV